VAVAVNSTISVWDISSDPHLVETFIGHAYEVSAIAFSSPSSLISASYDKSVKFWQIGTSSVEPAVVDPESTPTTLPLVSSISLKARVGVAISSNTAGEVETWDIPTNDCKAPSQALAKHYRHGHTKLINNRLIFVWYMDEEVSVWDAGKEEFLLQVSAPEDTTVDLRISGDGSKLFYIHCKFLQVWDIWTGVTVGKVEYEELNGVELHAMDGSRVWIKFMMGTLLQCHLRGGI
jgi:WD40 repeat protein